MAEVDAKREFGADSEELKLIYDKGKKDEVDTS